MTKYFSIILFGFLVVFTATNVYAWEGIVFDEVGVLSQDEYDQVSFIGDKLSYSNIFVEIKITDQDNSNFSDDEVKKNLLVLVVCTNENSLKIVYGDDLKSLLNLEKNNLIELFNHKLKNHNYAEVIELVLRDIITLIDKKQKQMDNVETITLFDNIIILFVIIIFSILFNLLLVQLRIIK